MDQNCIFCKIIAGEIPSKKIYEDDKMLAFYDIEPKAKVHFLVVPKTHAITCADDITEENSEVIAAIFAQIPKIVKSLGLTGGYRIINNCKEAAGQTVFHLHFHVLSGQELEW